MADPDSVPKCIANSMIGCSWWSQLCAEANPAGDKDQKDAHALRLNIKRTKLFTLNRAYERHASSFCDTLKTIPTGSSVDRARGAITRSETMICVGPDAAAPESDVCALIAFTSFKKRYVLPKLRGPSDFSIDRNLEPPIWDSLDDKDHYLRIVDPSEEFKGKIPNRFWTVLADIDAFEAKASVTVSRLRQFLGIDAATTPSILIRIERGKEPHFFIPTGWDAFTNQHFRENTLYDPNDSKTHFGHTLDLGSSSERYGAREVVAKPVRAGNTHLVRKYS